MHRACTYHSPNNSHATEGRQRAPDALKSFSGNFEIPYAEVSGCLDTAQFRSRFFYTSKYMFLGLFILFVGVRHMADWIHVLWGCCILYAEKQ